MPVSELVEQNDVDQLAEHLSNQGPFRSKELSVALEIAILKKSDKYCPCVNLLLSHDANPEGTNGSGAPFLVVTAEAGCTSILSSLLEAKCDPDLVRTGDGSTALHRAAWQDHVDCVQVLLDAGADTDLQDNQGRTPFLLAAQGDRIEVMELLLKTGCDPAIPDKKARTALYWAARYDNTEVLEFLLEEDEDIRDVIDMQDECGYTALMVGAERGHLETVNILLEYGATVNLESFMNGSALMLAARGQHAACACAILEAGGDVNVCDESGATPLIHLIRHSSAVYHLLNAGADPNVETKVGWTPLTLAASYDAYESLKLILRANCNFQGTNNSGSQRPVREAVVNGRFENVRLLLYAAVLLGLDIQWVKDYLQEAYLLYLSQQNNRILAIYSWLEEELKKVSLVPPLATLCRRCIRGAVGGCSFHDQLKQLPLPPALRTYLTLPELEHFDSQ